MTVVPGLWLSAPDGMARLADLADLAVGATGNLPHPAPALPLESVKAWVESLDVCPELAQDPRWVFQDLLGPLVARSVNPSDPRCAAHLHCATWLPAVAAELVVAATNQSMDSYDQAPAATYVEDRLMGWLASQSGLTSGSGVMTPGGTASNLLALTLARSRHARSLGCDVRQAGLPPGWESWRVVCSQDAHFSVSRAAAQLGLGTSRVTAVEVDEAGRMDPDALRRCVDGLHQEGLVPLAVVATAGTTDRGVIDPLEQVAEVARDAGAWFHVDAAVASAFILSDRLSPQLAGIQHADSVTCDFHKLWFLPISASALVVADPSVFEHLDEHHDYLDREEDAATGVLNLVGRSLDTTRRFDALKLLVALQTLGREGYASLVEHCVDTAAGIAREVAVRPDLELLAEPSSVTVLFRWNPTDRTVDLDEANTTIARQLLDSGQAVIGRTRLDGTVALKLTVVNPSTTVDDLTAVLDLVCAQGRVLPL
jgi:L-2,4-diaminobutyrate decarboxylase